MTLVKCLCGQPIGKVDGAFEGYCPKKGCRRLITVDTSDVRVVVRSST